MGERWSHVLLTTIGHFRARRCPCKPHGLEGAALRSAALDEIDQKPAWDKRWKLFIQ
jgi:hypothetical protein